MTRKLIILTALIIFLGSAAYCQTRRITGKVIDESFQPISGARIFTSDTTLVGIVDSNGNFNVDLPVSANLLKFGAVGLEWKQVRVGNDCNYLEIILLRLTNYDFISLQEVDRLRKKEFRKLRKLHAKGFENGALLAKKPCYDDIFKPVAN